MDQEIIPAGKNNKILNHLNLFPLEADDCWPAEYVSVSLLVPDFQGCYCFVEF